MKKALIIIALVLTSLGAFSEISMTSVLTIEQGTVDVKSFEFWLEKDSIKSYYFNFKDFEKNRSGNNYFNTNLFSYTNHNLIEDNYQIKIKLITNDTVIFLNTDIDLLENVTGLSVVSLIGKANDGKAYLKDLKIVRQLITDKQNLYLKPISKFKIKESPEFEIINKTNMNLFPYNYYQHFYGKVLVKKEGKWKSYDYVKPYQKFDCPTEENSEIIKCYFIVNQNCEKRLISEKGEYLFEISVGNEVMEKNVPEENIENKTVRIRKLEYFTLEYIFKI